MSYERARPGPDHLRHRTARAFSLAAAAGFLAGFPPAGRPDADRTPTLRLAFVTDDLRGHAGAALTERDDGRIDVVVTTSGDAERVRAQVERILALDVDGTGFAALGERDPVVGRLQAARPGLRPVLFHSPYEAAAWTVLSARWHHRQAVAARDRLSAELGAVLAVDGEPLAAFPLPERLLALDDLPGVPAEKLRRLHAVVEAALQGRLDAERLRALAPEEALADLRRIRGIGPFSAELVLVRATGATDVLPLHEPRVRRAAALAYGLAAPPEPEEFARLAEPWRPFRTWVCLLLRVVHGSAT